MQTEEYAKMRALEDHYWWFVSRRKMALKLLAQYAPKSVDVLDLGCGTGALMSRLEQTMKPVGLDYSVLAVEFCKERGLHDLIQGDAEKLPFQNDSFDAVVSLDTLEHVEHDDLAMKEIFRILRPGGVLVMNVPAYKWLWGPHDVALMHFRRYTRGSAVRLLERSGFKLESSSYSVFFLFPIVLLIRALDKTRHGPAKVRLPSVPSPINAALAILQDIETAILTRVPLPWGSSVVAVARKV